MFPGDVTLHDVIREYLARDDYNTAVADKDVEWFIKEDNFTEDILQRLVSIAYQKGATDASSLIGV